jgi:type IV pilus assembly protein PilA
MPRPRSLRRLPLGMTSHLRSRSREMRRRADAGFTLIELMMAAAIVGLISAVALPQFQHAGIIAEATTRISETITLAKQCAVGNKTGIEVTITDPLWGNPRVCNSSSIVWIFSQNWSGDASGTTCLSKAASSSHRRVKIQVLRDGSLGCVFLGSIKVKKKPPKKTP